MSTEPPSADANAVRETPVETLRRLMTERGISQGQIVKRAAVAGHKITQSSVSQILSGQQITLQSAQALAAALDVPPTLFMPEIAAMAGASSAGRADADAGVTLVPLITLRPSPLNPRKTFDASFQEALRDFIAFVRETDPSASLIDAVEAFIAQTNLARATQATLRSVSGLAESVAENGLLQNILARPDAEHAILWIVAGERRYWAIDLLWSLLRLPPSLQDGMPCRVLDISEAQHLALALLENLQREDVDPLQEAEGFVRLHNIDPKVWTTAEIARRVGVTQRHVQLRIQLVAKLSDDSKMALSSGTITLAQARAMTAATPETQAVLVRDISTGYIADADDIRSALARSNIPMARAIFDPAEYTGRVHVDDESGERFAQDGTLFLSLQRRAVDKRAQILRGSDIGVVRVILDSDSWTPDSPFATMDRIYPAQSPLPRYAQTAAAIVLTRAGEVRVYEKLMKLNDPPAAKPARGAATAPAGTPKPPPDPVAAVSRARRIAASAAKSEALQTALLHQPRVLYETFCLALITDGTVMGIQPAYAHRDAGTVAPIVQTALDSFARRLPPHISWEGRHLHSAAPLVDGDQQRVAEALRGLSDDELAQLMHALLAARVVAKRHDPTNLGDDAQAIDLAERLEIDMARNWRIDERYLAGLNAEQLEDLYYDLPVNRYIKPGPFFVLPLEERRGTLLDLIEQHDLHHAQPEMAFGGELYLAEAIRRHAQRHGRPHQTDLIQAIEAAKSAEDGTP
jgi:ParB family chromosome partitioning protein